MLLKAVQTAAAATATNNGVFKDNTRVVTHPRSIDFFSIRRRNTGFLCNSSSRRVAPVMVVKTEEQPTTVAIGLNEAEEEKSLADQLRMGSLTEDGLSYKERFIIRCYEVGINKTATVETIANLLQVKISFVYLCFWCSKFKLLDFGQNLVNWSMHVSL